LYKVDVLTQENAERKAVFLLPATQLTMLKKVLHPLACNLNGFLTRETVLLPFN
jgi:hypothetical protein